MARIAGVTDLNEIGRGGFGVVYRATETDLGRTVAVKLLPPLLDDGARLRFERERRALGLLSGHPHIVTVYRTGRTDAEEPFLIMEYCERGSIADELARAGLLAWARATDLGVKLAGALETAHRAGVIHRDIKPANVLLSNLGEPKLADFGIARLQGAPETRSASITASLAHVAPEVLDGDRPDARSDVYSLASTIYEFITGKPPFVNADDDSILPILKRIAGDPVPPVPAGMAPPALVAVLDEAMAKSPEGRPSTAADLGRRLIEAQEQAGVKPSAMMVEQLPGDVAVSSSKPPAGGPAADPRATVITPQALQAPAPSRSAQPTSAEPGGGLDTDETVLGFERGGSRSRRMWWLTLIPLAVVVAGSLAVIVIRNPGEVVANPTTIALPTSAPPPTATGGDQTTTSAEPSSGAPVSPIVTDEPLTLGALLPLSGDLAFLGPTALAAVELAVEDINDAGGVLGRSVALISADSRDGDEEHVRAEAAGLAAQSVDVVVGPMTSFNSRALIGDPSAEGFIMISPSATSSELTALDTNGIFFRTSPDEVGLANVAAEHLRSADVDRLAVVHVDDGYGSALSDRLRQRYAQLGGVVVLNTAYDPFGDIGPVVERLAAAGGDGIVIIGFGETIDILAALKARGVGPGQDGTVLFGIDANAILEGDGEALDGYRAIVAQIDLRPLSIFTSRLEAKGLDPANRFLFAPESYDAAVIAALAAETSGSANGRALSEAIVGVTKNGERCFDFAECKRLLAEGADIDYDGLAGPYELTEAGDPRVSSYVIYSYDGGERSNPELDQYVFSR